jgi:triphosphoribosyl-dephospho-CoA synthetase
VDRNDNGAHRDMDLAMMNRSIDALLPYFVKLALLGYQDAMPETEQVRQIGIDAERALLNATGGVNTHRGALFSMGLTTLAAAWCMGHNGTIEGKALQSFIQQLAGGFAPTAGTHGNNAVNAHRVIGALDLAKAGYPQLFNDWLPAYQGWRVENLSTARHKLLLLIMSQLDDTNVIHRVGYEQAQQVKQEAQALLNNYSTDGMEAMNRDYIARNISPGGSADMVALTLFIHAILN